MEILITNTGAKTNNSTYIGRPGELGNPFATKPSKFSTNIYSHDESMKMYFKYIRKEYAKEGKLKEEIDSLITSNNHTISCFCIHKIFTQNDYDNFDLKKVTCHGEIISHFIFELTQD